MKKLQEDDYLCIATILVVVMFLIQAVRGIFIEPPKPFEWVAFAVWTILFAIDVSLYISVRKTAKRRKELNETIKKLKDKLEEQLNEKVDGEAKNLAD